MMNNIIFGAFDWAKFFADNQQIIQSIVILIASPIATSFVKWLIGKHKTLIPYVCAALGGLLSIVSDIAGIQGVPVAVGVLLGIAGIGLREIYDQTKKALTSDTTITTN